jgi:predicted  nucleic acid-binding Zn-ribbon protein
MQERTILLRFLAAPLRQRLVAGGIAVVIGSGVFLWSRYGATPPATTAVLLFDAVAARQVDPGVMNAHAKEPAVALAQSILSDQAVKELAKQSGVSFASNQNEVAEFRSRLVLEQTSPRLLGLNYKDTDKKRSAMMANAVANLLVAWIPASSAVPTATSAPSPGALSAKPAKSRRRRHSLHAQSHELRELEKQVAGVDRKLTALNGHAVAPQQPSVAAPSASTDDEPRRTLESQLSAAQKKLDDLRARYTDEYPDVESTKDDIAEIRQKLASLPPVRNEAERAASSAKPDADANETDQLRLKRARLMEAIQVEKLREAERRDQTPSIMGDSALTAQTVSRSSTRQTPIPSQNSIAGQIWQRPFRLVRLAGDAGSGQSESGLLWYLPLAAILWGLLYSGVAMWRYRPIERAALLQLPVLNLSRLSRGPAATEPGAELGLLKQLRYCEKTIIEAALTECEGQVSGTSGAAAKLGVPASMLESKIKSLKIDKNHFKSAYLSTTSN